MKLTYIIFSIFFLAFSWTAGAQQAPPYEIMNGDTVNRTDEQGQKQGIWMEIFAEGTLEKETSYKDGHRNGLELTFWRVPNCMKEEAHYRNDTLDGYRILYYRDCKIRLLETYRDGILDGYVRKYHKNGELMAEGLYKGGELQGFMKEYNEDGKEVDAPTGRSRKVDLEGYVKEETPIEDSAILKSLTLLPVTKHSVIVTDVTGSMYAYVGQLLLWYKLNFNQTPVNQFTFFNDGDQKPDMTKRIGSTGGIYSTAPKKLVDLKKTMEEAINNGSGGDPQENNLEAVMQSLKDFKKVDKVILIVDRTSAVRDMSLLYRIKVPVYVILCGTPEYTNPQYLDIAYKTHGKIYTLDQEMQDIPAMHDGQTIYIANLKYIYKGGRFQRVLQ